MSRVENQRRLFLELVDVLRPHWRRDPGQPQRLADWLARHRAGSRDRRLYRELTYTLWRILPWVEDADAETLIARVAHHAHRTPATQDFIARYATASAAAPPPATALWPEWIGAEFPAGDDIRDCLLSRAPLWIRQQSEDDAAVRRDFPAAEKSAYLPQAWRLPMDTNVVGAASYRSGLVEIQDIGSQALLHALPHLPAGRWLDACAGAGGKTLQLAQMLAGQPATTITAHDIRPRALQELELRRRRAGQETITIRSDPEGLYDAVLVDAPCTGSGTWRRAPHLKWTTTPDSVRRAAEKQGALLAHFASLVKSGGDLIYLTCSLCASENQGVVADFRTLHPEFEPQPLRHPRTGENLATGELTLLPTDLDSDGYYIARMRRN